MRFSTLNIDCEMVMKCPLCMEKLRAAYMLCEGVLVCDKCKKAWQMYLREFPYNKVIEDGWGKKKC